jgi:hypothetical protein
LVFLIGRQSTDVVFYQDPVQGRAGDLTGLALSPLEDH